MADTQPVLCQRLQSGEEGNIRPSHGVKACPPGQRNAGV